MTFQHVSQCVKSGFVGQAQYFARFSENTLHFSWQWQHFGDLPCHSAWQARHFRRVVLFLFSDVPTSFLHPLLSHRVIFASQASPWSCIMAALSSAKVGDKKWYKRSHSVLYILSHAFCPWSMLCFHMYLLHGCILPFMLPA